MHRQYMFNILAGQVSTDEGGRPTDQNSSSDRQSRRWIQTLDQDNYFLGGRVDRFSSTDRPSLDRSTHGRLRKTDEYQNVVGGGRLDRWTKSVHGGLGSIKI